MNVLVEVSLGLEEGRRSACNRRRSVSFLSTSDSLLPSTLCFQQVDPLSSDRSFDVTFAPSHSSRYDVNDDSRKMSESMLFLPTKLYTA
jgi:hypothetical protein